MKKRLFLSAMTMVMVLSCGMTAFAAPELIEVDGETVLFDSEYYAENNADVAAVYGTDKTALARHYVTVGMGEGRLPYAPGTDLGAYRPVQEKKTLKKTETYNADGTLNSEAFYDSQGNKVKECGPDGRVWEEWTYDGEGNLIRDARGNLVEEYVYDHMGNMVRETTRIDDGFHAPEFREHIYSYDSQGNQTLVQIRNSEGGDLEKNRITQYEYDSQGRMTKEIDISTGTGQKQSETEYSYDSQGNVVRETSYMHRYNGGSYRSGMTEYFYDSNGNKIKEASVGSSGKDELTMSYGEWGYDSYGNMIRHDSYGPTWYVMALPYYEYDLDAKMLVPAPRGEGVVLSSSSECSYDSMGNLIREVATNFIYDWYKEYEYDSQGNMTLETEYSLAGEKRRYTVYIYE